MAVKTPPAVENTVPPVGQGVKAVDQGKHKGHKLTHCGNVVVPGGVGGQDHRPGYFDVWYCENDHTVVVDSTN